MIRKTLLLALMFAGSIALLGTFAVAQRDLCGACREQEQLLPEVVWPQIAFSIEPREIRSGEHVLLGWNVEDAEEVTLWASTDPLTSAEDVHWEEISELGESVALTDRMELPVEETTTFYVVARTGLGMAGAAIVVEVLEDVELVAPHYWRINKRFSKASGERPATPTSSVMLSQVESALTAAGLWFASPAPPTASSSVNPHVFFENGSTTLAWNVTNASTVSFGTSMTRSFLAADATKLSGTKSAGASWGSGGSPPLDISKTNSYSGTATIKGLPQGPRHEWRGVSAYGLGASATAQEWTDVLSIPKFQGCSSSRQNNVRNAILDIDQNLRTGCIYYNTGLDKTVAAFKAGHLSRKGVWGDLVVHLQNIELVTFNCKDVTDNKWAAGGWADYSNTIDLEWSPNHTPWLEYVILHELLHKIGFHSALKKYYSIAEIENQVHTVEGACYP